MRIVAGAFKGQGLAAPRSHTIRPTADRLRETIFDILVHRYEDPVTDAHVLDLFAGTGALGLEALSRGAASCLFVDDGIEARALIRTNIDALKLTGRTRIFRRDATKLGPASTAGTVGTFSLLFADPPYGNRLAETALASAATGGWLDERAICVVEEEAGADFSAPSGFTLEDERFAGDSRVMFLRFGPLEPAS